MSIVLVALYYALWIFSILVLGRIILEIIQSFNPSWRPRGFMALVAEVLYTPTDPPLRFVRSHVPSLPIGPVRLDLSALIVLLTVSLLMSLITRLLPLVG